MQVETHFTNSELRGQVSTGEHTRWARLCMLAARVPQIEACGEDLKANDLQQEPRPISTFLQLACQACDR